MVVAVAGATGLVGRNLVLKLLADPLVAQVKVLVRRAGSFEAHPKLLEVLLPAGGTGYSAIHDPSEAAYSAEVYYCCLGTTIRKAGSREAFRAVDHDAILVSARLAEAQGARAFVLVSSIGANPSSPFFYPRVKGEVEAAISALRIPRVVFFRPSFLVSREGRSERRFGEELGIGLFRLGAPFLPAPIRDRFGSDVDVLAQAMIADGVGRGEPGRIIVEAAEIPGRLR
jgi:uncharacterized protein YbjT (DUF2867 family)